MGTILNRLKKHYQETPPEQIKRDWEASAKYDEVDSPRVNTYIKQIKNGNISSR